MPSTKHVERIVQSLAGRQSAIVMVDDIEQGIDVANGYAAEHLEIQTANPEQVASMITNAGAVFVGPWSPVSLGDYCAGSTHVLPTGGVPLLGIERAELPQNDAHRQLHPDRLRRGRPQGGGLRRRRGPTGTRCCNRPQVLPVDAHAVMSGATASPALDELPLRPELVRRRTERLSSMSLSA